MSFAPVPFIVFSIGIFISQKTSFAAPALAMHKCGNSILGIEMIDQESDGKHTSGVKYLFPVTNMGEHNCEDCNSRVASLIPLRDFYLEMMPLKTYLEENKLPPFVKLLLVNANCKQ